MIPELQQRLMPGDLNGIFNNLVREINALGGAPLQEWEARLNGSDLNGIINALIRRINVLMKDGQIVELKDRVNVADLNAIFNGLIRRINGLEPGGGDGGPGPWPPGPDDGAVDIEVIRNFVTSMTIGTFWENPSSATVGFWFTVARPLRLVAFGRRFVNTPQAPVTSTLRLWTGGSATVHPTTQLTSADVPRVTGEWSWGSLAEPYTVVPGTDYWLRFARDWEPWQNVPNPLGVASDIAMWGPSSMASSMTTPEAYGSAMLGPIDFRYRALADFVYVNGPTHGQGNQAFIEGVEVPDGRVVLVPHGSANVGLYDPHTNTYTRGAAHNSAGTASGAFAGGVLLPDGRVVLVPRNAPQVGLYDARTDTYTNGPTHGFGTNVSAFRGGCLLPDGRVVFAPMGAANVGLYNPQTNTYANGPAHGRGTSVAFQGAVLLPNGRVCFIPTDAAQVGLYDPVANSFIVGPAHNMGTQAFNGGVLPPGSDEVVMASNNVAILGLYNWRTNIYRNGPAHGRGAFNIFQGAGLAHDGRVILSPAQANVGTYVPETNTYINGPAHGQSTTNAAFCGVVTLSKRRGIVLVPRSSANVGLLLLSPRVWNASDRGQFSTLSTTTLADDTLTVNPGHPNSQFWMGVRCPLGYATGSGAKRVFTITVRGSAAQWIGGIWIAAISVEGHRTINQGGYPGAGPGSIGINSQGQRHTDGGVGVAVNINIAVGGTLWVACDFDTNTMHYGSNNTVSLTTPIPTAGTYFPGFGGQSPCAAQINTRPDISGLALEGFKPWDFP